MTLFYGAQYDLESMINTHLFIICPNNSGSSFVKNALATSKHTWNLNKEGQHCYGFTGPNTRACGARLIWASEQSWIEKFADTKAYDWSQTRKAWYFQALSCAKQATIFVTSSPPFLLNVAQLKQQFKNAHFIFMVRNPYAVVEGIYRRASQQPVRPGANILEIAATHIINCFIYQQNNLAMYQDCGVFFSYETLCRAPENVATSIQSMVPELDDLRLNQIVPVKAMYNQMLQNMNKQQISRLSQDDLQHINRIFEKHQKVLDYFNYALIST
ncbi:MAG: sulfotransferase [Gammaproteobacteria bacterium]|nr:sulfotransferase [Gammaproteobacteria bacterium]